MRISQKGRNILCCIILIILIAEEILLGLAIEGNGSWWPVAAITVVLISLFIFLYQKNSLSRLSTTLHKLFQSQTSAVFTIFILLFFLVHLELISNAIYDAFFAEDTIDTTAIWKAAVCLIALLLSAKLYPVSRAAKPVEERTLLISGLSLAKTGPDDTYGVSPQNIDLLIKPFIGEEWNKITDKKTGSAIKDLVVIPSREVIPNFTDWQPNNPFFLRIKDERERERIRCEYNAIIKEYNARRLSEEACLSSLIACLTGKSINVSVRKAIDYDDMQKALSRINEILKEFEVTKGGLNDTGNTLLYISPGTGVIGSALACFAVPGDRAILYYTQTQKDNYLSAIGLQAGAHYSIMEEIEEKN